MRVARCPLDDPLVLVRRRGHRRARVVVAPVSSLPQGNDRLAERSTWKRARALQELRGALCRHAFSPGSIRISWMAISDGGWG